MLLGIERSSLIGKILYGTGVLASSLVTTTGLVLLMAKLSHSSFDEPPMEKTAAIEDIYILNAKIDTRYDIEKPIKPDTLPDAFELEALPEPDIDIDLPEMGGLGEFKTWNSKVDTGDLNFVATDRSPMHKLRAKPRYPKAAKRAKIEGTVYLEFDINIRGATENIKVLESQPKGVFDQAAISAVKKWRYQPKVNDGKKVRTRNFRNRINFKLGDA